MNRSKYSAVLRCATATRSLSARFTQCDMQVAVLLEKLEKKSLHRSEVLMVGTHVLEHRHSSRPENDSKPPALRSGSPEKLPVPCLPLLSNGSQFNKAAECQRYFRCVTPPPDGFIQERSARRLQPKLERSPRLRGMFNIAPTESVPVRFVISSSVGLSVRAPGIRWIPGGTRCSY